MIVKPFHPQHMRLLEARGVQPQQQGTVSSLLAELARLQHPGGQAFTGFVGDRIIGCAGLVTVHDRMGLVWALLAHDAGPHMVAITRAVRRFLDMNPLQRIEASCEFEWRTGWRWLELLGFVMEGPMFCYGPNGEMHARFARCVHPKALAAAERRVA